jgi:hypothetical protein
MNLISIDAMINKIKLFNAGWYTEHSMNYSKIMLNSNRTESQIYFNYNKNWFTRIRVLLKYNTSLFRSKKKFIIFIIFNILIYHKKYK